MAAHCESGVRPILKEFQIKVPESVSSGSTTREHTTPAAPQTDRTSWIIRHTHPTTAQSAQFFQSLPKCFQFLSAVDDYPKPKSAVENHPRPKSAMDNYTMPKSALDSYPRQKNAADN